MRFESSITSVSWIPSESVAGLYKAGFAVGASHPDDPPPEVLEDLDGLFAAEKFRFANRLAAWIEVEGNRVVDAGYAGRGYISGTRFGWGPHREVAFQPAEFPEIRATPEITRGEMTGASPLAKGTLLAEQGDPGHDIYLLLDGVLSVSVDGAQVGELGPGAVMGERALLEGGRRTATLRAVTDCVIATAANDQIDRGSLSSLAELHHREDPDR
jgi:hypothetical protein